MRIYQNKTVVIALLLLLLTTASCNRSQDVDATGVFEAVETIVSAEVTGKLIAFDLEEGSELKAGQVVGQIDSVQLYLRLRQLEAQVSSTLVQRPDIRTQIAALQVQLAAAERERKRVNSLLAAGAATRKQMDDMDSQVETFKKQLAAQQSSLGITSRSITEQTSPLRFQAEQVRDQLIRCRIINPVAGTVLTKYAEQHEIAAAGKPIYKIADLSQMTLRAYVTGNQLAAVRVGQKVTVMVSQGEQDTKSYPGTVTWISDKAEFTPKTIQTKDERENLVYAVKIRVANDGLLKIGMYADVKF